jgi:hypothetical protein
MNNKRIHYAIAALLLAIATSCCPVLKEGVPAMIDSSRLNTGSAINAIHLATWLLWKTAIQP